MRGTIWAVALAAAVALSMVGGRPALAGQKRVGCDKVLAAAEKAGGSKSADELAKELGTTPARVRHCMQKTGDGKNPVPLRKQPAPGEPTPK
ncbi:MAG TPA: hypothetical protein VFD92_23360 [Candidatus Binatia bacterium]|nr:hypothetical protein [Candidatus Binatia bacterium]